MIARLRAPRTQIEREPGSFRDPSNGVFEANGAIYRFFKGDSASEFEAFLASDLHRELTSSHLLVQSSPVTS